MMGRKVVGVQESLYTGHGDGYGGPGTVSWLPLAKGVVAGMAHFGVVLEGPSSLHIKKKNGS